LLTFGSENQRQEHMRLALNGYVQTLSLHTRKAPTDPAALRMAFESVLRLKGRVLDVMSAQIEALRRRAAPDDLALLNKLSEALTELAGRELSRSDSASSHSDSEDRKAIERRIADLQDRIARKSRSSFGVSELESLDAVRAAVPPDCALVEYARFLEYDFASSPWRRRYGPERYVVYVLTKDGGPAWADLGEAATVDASVERFRAALSDPTRRDVRRLGRELDRLVGEPVRKLVGGRQHLLVAPDGALNLVPFESLVDERGRYLVETRELTYLTSGRDLLRMRVKSVPRQHALVLANPDYGDISLASNEAARDIAMKNAESTVGSVDFGSVAFPPLANTGAEAQALGALLPKSTVLTDEAATEAVLKKATAPSILHIATHGFFLPDLEVRRRLSDDGGRVKVENPLLRSGLALAGANARKSGEDDGILTAAEVAGLDLWGTKLVVLSACETGVGEVRNGDGVYGLRRALVLAGSESQMMSLWRVSDRATRDLMVAYYRGLLAGQGRTAALRRVQLRMLRRPATRHPFYWAGFIQSGAWTPLAEK
jgi:CHAT domain-containing protein